MKVLAFDCSSAMGSVAVVENNRTHFSETFACPRGRGGAFFPALDRAMTAAGRVDRIAVGIGPGSYNGLRAAIAAAEGLHLALGAEKVGVVSARALPGEAEDYFALGDARGGVFWLARVTGRVIRGAFELLPVDVVRARLEADPNVARISTAPTAEFPGIDVRFPDAAILARLGTAEIPCAEGIDPLYLKPAHITAPRGRA